MPKNKVPDIVDCWNCENTVRPIRKEVSITFVGTNIRPFCPNCGECTDEALSLYESEKEEAKIV